jgi:hypothetical protein
LRGVFRKDMHSACDMVERMGHIPDDLHRRLKARAAEEGMSLSEYLLAEMSNFASLPTLKEHVARARARPMVHFDVPAAELIREAREERERDLDRATGRRLPP